MNPFPDGFHPYYCYVCGESFDDAAIHACKGSPKTMEALEMDLTMPSSMVSDLVLVGVEVPAPEGNAFSITPPATFRTLR